MQESHSGSSGCFVTCSGQLQKLKKKFPKWSGIFRILRISGLSLASFPSFSTSIDSPIPPTFYASPSPPDRLTGESCSVRWDFPLSRSPLGLRSRQSSVLSSLHPLTSACQGHHLFRGRRSYMAMSDSHECLRSSSCQHMAEVPPGYGR